MLTLIISLLSLQSTSTENNGSEDMSGVQIFAIGLLGVCVVIAIASIPLFMELSREVKKLQKIRKEEFKQALNKADEMRND